MLFRNYKIHGYKEDDKLRLDAFRAECQVAVETAKVTYKELSEQIEWNQQLPQVILEDY